jgi:hypothetical protein
MFAVSFGNQDEKRRELLLKIHILNTNYPELPLTFQDTISTEHINLIYKFYIKRILRSNETKEKEALIAFLECFNKLCPQEQVFFNSKASNEELTTQCRETFTILTKKVLNSEVDDTNFFDKIEPVLKLISKCK